MISGHHFGSVVFGCKRVFMLGSPQASAATAQVEASLV
jgi:hypothetical protein